MARKNDNMISEYMEKLQEWWKTDTAKAVATIVAVLLIPASVLAWNYYTSDENAVSEESSDQNISSEKSAMTDENGEATQSEDSQMEQPAVGGISEVSELPNTSSTESVSYVVKNGDSVYKISMKVCGDSSFYLSKMRKNYLRVGETLTVTCE